MAAQIVTLSAWEEANFVQNVDIESFRDGFSYDLLVSDAPLCFSRQS